MGKFISFVISTFLIIFFIFVFVIGNKVDKALEEKNNISVETSSQTNNVDFTLKYNELGEFGKKENLNGNYESIIYKIPVGNYQVQMNKKSTAKIATLFVQQDAVHTESTGEKIHNIDKTYYFNDSNNYKNIIEVKEKQNIFISINSQLDFIKQ